MGLRAKSEVGSLFAGLILMLLPPSAAVALSAGELAEPRVHTPVHTGAEVVLVTHW